MQLSPESTVTDQHIHDPDLELHLRALGLESIVEYQDWCSRNGYSVRVNKTWRERCRERFQIARDSIKIKSQRSRDEKRNPIRVIRAIFDEQLQEANLTLPSFKLIHKSVAGIDDPAARANFLRLLVHVSGRTKLVDSQPVIRHFGAQPGNTYIEALQALASCHTSWVRSLDVRGKVNRMATAKELDIVRQWAAQEGLALDELI